RRAAESLAAAQSQTAEALADRVEQVYERVASRRRSHAPTPPSEERGWIVADIHLQTSWSHDCWIDVDELVDHAEAKGLGAIAVTDHNVFGGAQEAVERARGRRLIVIPGEEIKTADEGEVIGLFLREEIPRGMSFGDTIAAIRAQGGLVYVPHPFDRMHAIPGPATLHRHLAEIDVLEVYNARLLFEAYNEEALRFARKYNLTPGAGSDAHVLAGVGTGAVRMRRFSGPEEFASRFSAPAIRSPTSSSSSTRRRRRSCRRESPSTAAPATRSSSRCSACTSIRWRSTGRTASSSPAVTRRSRGRSSSASCTSFSRSSWSRWACPRSPSSTRSASRSRASSRWSRASSRSSRPRSRG